MRQIVRRVIDRKGKVVTIELPMPQLGPHQVLAQNCFSLISSGTEMSTLSKTPPELVKQTLSDPWMREAVKRTILAAGPIQTVRRVWHEMVVPREIGYSGAGKALAIGSEVKDISVGDTVAYAAVGHAEVVAPAFNHVVGVPDTVPLKEAAFVTVGGIAMQSLRRADIQFGETIAVYGLGLVGQLCAQIAQAAGCVVVGIDLNEGRTKLAAETCCDYVYNPLKVDLERSINEITAKHGVDATIICASTKSPEVINKAIAITRRQGRVVIVGYVKLDIHPKNFLYKELDLRYSRAFGPGSYHTAYEKGRLDYPFGYVRWTEKRNLAEFIRLIGAGKLKLGELIGESFPVKDAQQAFDQIRAGTLKGVAALIDYRLDSEVDMRKAIPVPERPKQKGQTGIAIVGCGNHVLGLLLPALRKIPEVSLRGLVSASGKNAHTVAHSSGAPITATDIDSVLSDTETDALMICSAQQTHFEHVRAAIEKNKAIFVEKPLVMLRDHLSEICELMDRQPVLFTLGLNRRYSPLIQRLRDELQGAVKAVHYTVSQSFIPPDHKSLDPDEGGGRLIAEGEHFIDLCHLLIGEKPQSIQAFPLGERPDDLRTLSQFVVMIRYPNAVGTITFVESGAPGFPRERLQVEGPGQVAVLEDFAKLTIYGKKTRSWGRRGKIEMGHREQLKEFIKALRGEPNQLLDWEGALAASRCMFAAEESLRSGETVYLDRFLAQAVNDEEMKQDSEENTQE
jgi:predicted dehydrogenase/threonine dehydrogenase-like Zn-dependent dehydrogenase